MNKEKQRILIAEACGLTLANSPHHSVVGQTKDGKTFLPLPDFLNDLNACHEMEKVLTDDQWTCYEQQLRRAVAKADRHEYWSPYRTIESVWCCAKAFQRAEAFLRTLNLWEEPGQEK
jgi:hypothetical protein